MKSFKTILILFFTSIFILQYPNLFSGKIEKDETMLLPTTYGWTTNGEINILVHAWVFELEDDSILRKGFIELLEEHFENATAAEKKNFENRLKFFLVDNHRGKDITINISGNEYPLTATSPNGHSLTTVKIKDQSKFDTAKIRKSFTTLPGDAGTETFTGTFQIIGEKGYSIISDIDDTIKESNVLDKKELVKNTFFRKFSPVKGMPQLYQKFESKGIAFHYVSGSPWQLYPAINSFLHDEQFPEGAVELKLFRVKDRSIIKFISADQLTYKLNAIKTIIDRFPQRKFILIGDSGEKDPEVYTEIADQYKDRVKYIFIRDAGLIEENSPRRKSIIAKAGKTKIVIFRKAEELEIFLSEL